MDKARWMLDYEAAFLACNGKPCKIIHNGRGWYGIEHADARPIYTHRRAQIIEMTANLKLRAQEMSPTP